jgi:hypothetical protein
MASHLNAHNMPGPAPGVGSSAAKPRRRWLWVAIGILTFFLLDRASLFFVPPQYRGVPDLNHYHTLYYSLKFQQFNRIKNKLETIVVGDSRTRHGVDPELFNSQSDESSVTAFNFAPASSGIEFTDLLAHEYFFELPRLRTIVWGISPRIFNRYWQDPVNELFLKSRGYWSDHPAVNNGYSKGSMKSTVELGTHRMISKLSATFAHRSKLKSIFLDGLTGDHARVHFHVEPAIGISKWGFMEFPESQVIDVTDRAEVERILQSLESGRFELDETRLQKFRQLIGFLSQSRIRLVCFVPPMHHSLTRSPAADADGMPNNDYDKLMSTLKSLEMEFGNYHFLDLHKGGDNGFADHEYADFDHLNYAGSRRLSRTIAQTLERVCAETLTLPQTVGPVAQTPLTVQGQTPQQANDANQESGTSAGEDRTAPEIESHLGDLDYMVGAFPPDNRPLIWAEYDDEGSGIDTKSVHLFMDGKDITKKCKITPAKISFKPAKTLKAPKLYTFKVVVSDKAGNESELVWEILLKPC